MQLPLLLGFLVSVPSRYCKLKLYRLYRYCICRNRAEVEEGQRERREYLYTFWMRREGASSCSSSSVEVTQIKCQTGVRGEWCVKGEGVEGGDIPELTWFREWCRKWQQNLQYQPVTVHSTL